MKILEKVQLDAFQRMSWVDAKRTSLYVDTKTLKKGQVIQAGRKSISVEKDTMMAFADEAPSYNWSHPCRYLLYDAGNGELYEEVRARFPPYMVNVPKTYTMFHKAVLATPYAEMGTCLDWATQLGSILSLAGEGKRYAVLFSGSSNYRHVNDLEFLYRTLIDVYGFSPNNISVLNYDGTLNYAQEWGIPAPGGNWPGDNTAYRMVVNDAGTKQNLENVMDNLKAHLRSKDFVLIHMNNHGDGPDAFQPNIESCLCTYSGPWYDASDFAAKLAELPRFSQLMVMMEQCHSGGFNQPIIDNSPADETTVASACEEDRSSTGGNGIFDPFARDWIAAVNGADPYAGALDFDPDIINDGLISASEAFNYADTVKDPYDTPVYNEAPGGCGDDMHLGLPEPTTILDKVLGHEIFERAELYAYALEKLKKYLPPIPVPPPSIPVPEPNLMRAQAARHAARVLRELMSQ